MGTKDNKGNGNDKKMDRSTMLDAYIEKFGLGPIVQDALGDIEPDMTMSEFLKYIEDKGIKDIVSDMTLGELFNVKPKVTEPKVLKENIVKLLSEKTGLTVKQIGDELGEQGKHLSVALSALKKAEKLDSEGEKKQMKYSLAAE
ncbi:MAG: hypothetical protein ACTSW7_00515 [Candidatus Thorarchaeota archaeon]|nr:hypothetical protein [Thermoplasmatales archaeon]